MSDDLLQLEALLALAVERLDARGRAQDDGSLLKIGRFEARRRAIAALPAGPVREALVAQTRLDLFAAFPASLSLAFNDDDEDLHHRFEAIGRERLSQGTTA